MKMLKRMIIFSKGDPHIKKIPSISSHKTFSSAAKRAANATRIREKGKEMKMLNHQTSLKRGEKASLKTYDDQFGCEGDLILAS